MTDSQWLDADNSTLLAEIKRLNKMATALMDRAEREMGDTGSHFNMFQSTLTLEKQVHQRTAALEAAVQENQRINRALQREKAAQALLIQRLENTQAQLAQSEKLASLGALVAGIAHELNTPIGNGVMAISTLRSALERFHQSTRDGIKRSALETLLAAIETGSDITQRNLQRAAELITSFKQVAADQTSSQRREFPLDETIVKILQTIQPSLRHSLAGVHTGIPAGIIMDSYPGPLAQIIGNLVGNAAMHAFEGQPPGEVSIDARMLDAEHVRIRVIDNGIGIPDELLPKIFDPFVTTKMGRGGTGLGLSIVHNIAVQVLGGEITVSSRVGHGTTFNVDLPLLAPKGKPRSEDAN